MATFSFGTGIASGAPGTYINERAGNIAIAGISTFNTTYLLVETEEDVPVTRFPFNTPVPVSSVADFKLLVGGIPSTRIPELSYNCVDTFFSNAQVGDLRVVRVGTPDQIVEIEIFPSGTKINSTGLPSSLQAGDVVYAQITLNGLKLVTGDGSTGYTAEGEWLGVPVVIPVNYISGDAVNNRKISSAITTAIATAIETNPSVRSAIYVRDFGSINDINPSSNSENGYITVAATTYNGSVSVVTEQNPVGAQNVLMQNTYDVQNIVGLSTNLERVPQDYIQCINTAFDGQTNQGYLITPAAFAQFDAEGRAAVGAAIASHCQDNNFKWMGAADAGPFYVTDINKYNNYVPHEPAADLVTGNQYLVDNAIYKWTGADVNYDRLKHQAIVPGYDPKVAVQESTSVVALDEKSGILDLAVYTATSTFLAEYGVFQLNSNVSWPSDYQIQEVTLSDLGADFLDLLPVGETSTNVYFIAPAYDSVLYGPYPSDGTNQYVFITTTAADAVSVLTEVTSLGGTAKVVDSLTAPAGAYTVAVPTDSTAQATYVVPQWNLPVTINSQTSNLVQNITGGAAYVNTLHLPGTLQDPTEEYRLSFVSRTMFNPAGSLDSGSLVAGSDYETGTYTGVPLTGGTGSGAKATIVVDGAGEVSAVTLETLGTGYTVGDTLSADDADLGDSGLGAGFAIDVLSLNSLFSSTTPGFVNSLSVSCEAHGLISGQKLFFTQPVYNNSVVLIKATSKVSTRAYFVKVVDNDNFVLSTSYANYLAGSYIPFPTGTVSISTGPVVFYTAMSGGGTTAVNLSELTAVPFIRGRKYGFASGTIAIEAASTSSFTSSVNNPLVSIYMNTSGQVLANERILPYGETAQAGWLPSLSLVTPGSTTTSVENFLCVPTVDQSFATEAYLVPAIDAIEGGDYDPNTNPSTGVLTNATAYVDAILGAGDNGTDMQNNISKLLGVFFNIIGNSGKAPDGSTDVVVDDRIAVVYTGSGYEWVVVPAEVLGGDLSSVAQICYGSQVELAFTQEQTPPANLWRFDAITSTEIIDSALRGVGFSGEPQAVFIEAGVDNVNRLYEDSQRYFNAFGFIAFYGPYVENSAGQYIPPTPYVTGVATRRYRSEGFQFPPAGTKYQLSDAVGVQIAVNSAQQNLLNPDGCNVLRSLPGYPNTAVFIWGGRTRINKANANERKFQFVNTRVIQNVIYGSLRSAFDDQIFTVVDGFGIVFNQIVSIGNSVLNQLYNAGALYGARPSDAYQVICDDRINTPENLENGIVNVKVFDVPVPTLERIEIDLIRVSIGQMNNELASQGLIQNF
jgi:hypothetical protein